MPGIDFAERLNAEQLAAVTHGDGPQLVIAGAGSGKTRVISYRIAWLVQERGVDPREITAVTFTNKAAAEMRERVEELLELYPLPASVGTFHRWALIALRSYGDRVGLQRDFAIFDTSDQKALLKKAMAQEELDEGSYPPSAVLGVISGAKNRLVGPERFAREADGFFSQRVAPVYATYQKMLRHANAVDFDDMIALSVELLRSDPDLRRRIRRRTRYLLVDEFQDTNHAQLSLIYELASERGNLTAVGDEDQGIYRWRGAELDNILRFEDSFPGAQVRKLERNYRSTQTILDAAGAVVDHNEKRRGKRLWTDAGAGEDIVLYHAADELDEARWVGRTLRQLEVDMPLAEMAVLVRTNAQTRALEEELLSRRMAYTLVGGLRFYERAEIKDLVAYLRLLRNPRDAFSFSRVLNKPPRGIGRTTEERLETLAAERGTTPWEVLESGDYAAVGKRGTKALREFHALVRHLRDAAEDLPLPALLRRILDDTGYGELHQQRDEESQARRENVDELLTAAQEFVEKHAYGSAEEDLLGAFLDHVALTSDADTALGRGVSLMTLHSAKGLEFGAVVIAGLEENVLPHFNAQTHPDDLEEERRLLYVGMTRAKRRLYLTTCRRRRVAGRYQDQQPSRFLAEIPKAHLQEETSPELRAASYGGYGGYGTRSGGQAESVYAFFQRPGQAPATSRPTAPASLSRPAAAARRAAPASASGGGDMRRGATVRHATLGRGKVLAVDGSGDEQRLTVYFDGVGRRKLVARYANLEVL